MKKRMIFYAISALLMTFGMSAFSQNSCETPDSILSLPYFKPNLKTDSTGNNYNKICEDTIACACNDYVFAFVPPSDMHVNISLSNTAAVTAGIMTGIIGSQPATPKVGLYVVDHSPSTDGIGCIASETTQDSDNPPRLNNVELSEGTTYFIIVSTGKFSTTFLGQTNEQATTLTFDINVSQASEVDLAVESITPIATACGMGNTEITATVKNLGTQNIDNYSILCQVNEDEAMTQDIEDELESGDPRVHTFQADLSTVGDYTIKVWVECTNDADRTNDTAITTTTNLPTTEIAAGGNNLQDFEANDGQWIVGGTNPSWAWGTPAGTTITGTGNAWVTNLTGNANGGEKSWIISPCYDLSNLVLPIISYDYIAALGQISLGTKMQLDYTIDNGATFVKIDSISTSGTEWKTRSNPVPELHEVASVRFRVSFNAPTFDFTGEGIEGVGFDNFKIEESRLKDVAVINITAPLSDCGLGEEEVITIEVVNLGVSDIDNTEGIPVTYSIDGGETWIEAENITDDLPSGDTVSYSFTTRADLSEPGIYQIHAKTELEGDEDTDNDEFATTVVNAPLYTAYPVEEHFEENNGYWSVGGTNPSWEYGIPHGATINQETNCWVTRLDSSANNGENSWIESPCYDLTSLQHPKIMFYYCTALGSTSLPIPGLGLGAHVDLLLSKDQGATWDSITSITASTTGWQIFDTTLSALHEESNVRFRIQYIGAIRSSSEGVGIDNFVVQEAAAKDAAIIDITSPVSGCGLDGAQITAVIQNRGTSAISDFDIKYTIDGGDPVTETYNGTIEPSSNANFTFTRTANLSSGRSYEIKVIAALEDDEENGNDTATRTVLSQETIVANPGEATEEDFERDDGYWYSHGTSSSWEWGTPEGTIITDPEMEVWATNLSGNANSGEKSYLESQCYDLSQLNNPGIEVNINYELGTSGSLYVEYSTDGEQWDTVFAAGDTVNWYRQSLIPIPIPIPGLSGGTWTGSSSGWKTARTALPNFGENNTSVKFRFVFKSGFQASEGVAVNNFAIIDMPVTNVTANFTYEVDNLTATFTNTSENATSYAWDFGDDAISTETSPEHTYAAAGTYNVTLEARNGEVSDSKTQEVTVTMPTGITDSEAAGIKIFPNPADDNITITGCNAQKLTITNVAGSVVYETNVNSDAITVDVDKFAPGAYLIKLVDRNNAETAIKFMRK